MYNTILQLLIDAIGATAGTLPYDTCQVIATVFCVFVVLIPFIIVWYVIKTITGGR